MTRPPYEGATHDPHRRRPAGVTPAEEDLPEDHLGRRPHPRAPHAVAGASCRPSLRDRGPKVVREKLALHFSGGHYGFTRDAPDGQWCDLWLYDDLVLPTGLLHAAAGVPPGGAAEHPGDLRGLPRRRPTTRRPGWSTWTPTTSRSRSTTPTRSPASPARASPSGPTRTSASRCVQIYNDWMIDEWCGGDGQGRLIPLTLVPLWDPAAGRRRGAPLRGQGQLRHRVLGEPVEARLPVALQRRRGTCCGTPARRPTPPSRCTSARRRPCRPTSPDAPLATTMALSSQNAEGSLCDWVFSGTLSRFPELKIAFAESQIGWMPYLLERMDIVAAEAAAGGVDLDRPAERDRQGPGVGLRVRRPARAQQPRRGRPRAHPVRDRLPPHRRHLARLAGRGPPAVRHRRHGRRGVLRRSCAATPSAATASIASASPRRWRPPASTRRRPRRAELPALDLPDGGLLGAIVRLNLAVTHVLEEHRRSVGLTFADYLVLGVVRRSPDQRSAPTAIADRARPHDRRHDPDPRPPRGGRPGAPDPPPRRRPPGRRRADRRPAVGWPRRSTPPCTSGRPPSTCRRRPPPPSSFLDDLTAAIGPTTH